MSPLRIFSLKDVFKIFKELSDIKQFELQRTNRHKILILETSLIELLRMKKPFNKRARTQRQHFAVRLGKIYT